SPVRRWVPALRRDLLVPGSVDRTSAPTIWFVPGPQFFLTATFSLLASRRGAISTPRKRGNRAHRPGMCVQTPAAGGRAFRTRREYRSMAKKTSAPPTKTKPAAVSTRSEAALVKQALETGQGILRLAPTWVPRSFLMPGRRIKLAPQDLYALGAHRGGIDERWFASTTAAANEGAPPDEGLSYIVHDGKRALTLRDAVAQDGAKLIGSPLWDRYQRWPVYSKFFDNLGPIPHHMHQNNAQAAKVGQQGKPESYYFPPQLNALGNNFPYTFFGLEP